MKTYFYATSVDIFVGCHTTNLSTWGLAFSRYSAKKGVLITTKLPLGTVFGVLGPPNKTSYHVNYLGALFDPKDGDQVSCTT